MKIDEPWSLHRNSKSYTGAFPEGLMKKLNSLIYLGDKKILHLFGGIHPQGFDSDTNDINKDNNATYHFDARKEFPINDNSYDVIICDPPYDMEQDFIHLSDSKKRLHYGKNLYNTSYVPPYSFTDECVRICKPNGFIVVLHFLVYSTPKKTKRYKLIPIVSGPNLRIRALSIFQKHPSELCTRLVNNQKIIEG